MANPLAPVKGLRGFWPNGILPQGRMLGLVVVVGCFLGVLAVIVTIHLDAPVSGAFFRTLATKAKGSSLLVSGRFVASRVDSAANPLPRDPGTFEQSATEDGSMREPEYKGLLRE
jgi:hypothetical protein